MMTAPIPPQAIPQYAPDSYPVTQGQLRRCLNDLWTYMLAQTETITNLGEKVSVTQADLDALTASINADVTKINSEIAALQAANPNLDLSALQAAVSGLDSTANPPAPPAPSA